MERTGNLVESQLWLGTQQVEAVTDMMPNGFRMTKNKIESKEEKNKSYETPPSPPKKKKRQEPKAQALIWFRQENVKLFSCGEYKTNMI